MSKKIYIRTPPEGFLVFILRAVKYFRDDNFLMKNSDNQIRLLAHISETCTLNALFWFFSL